MVCSEHTRLAHSSDFRGRLVIGQLMHILHVAETTVKKYINVECILMFTKVCPPPPPNHQAVLTKQEKPLRQRKTPPANKLPLIYMTYLVMSNTTREYIYSIPLLYH